MSAFPNHEDLAAWAANPASAPPDALPRVIDLLQRVSIHSAEEQTRLLQRIEGIKNEGHAATLQRLLDNATDDYHITWPAHDVALRYAIDLLRGDDPNRDET